MGRLLFNVLTIVAEFEGALIRLRTREGMRVAKTKGHLRSKHPSSTCARKHTWSPCTRPAGTALASWATCSESPVRLSTGRSSATLRANAPGCPAVLHWEVPCRTGSQAGRLPGINIDRATLLVDRSRLLRRVRLRLSVERGRSGFGPPR